jgi:drug/metabolite transporter (DMT)-like permease
MTWLLLSIVIAATVASDLLQSYEMKRLGDSSGVEDLSMDAQGLGNLLKTIARRRYLILSIACLAISFFTFMALVQTAPLSFAVPATAASFVVETILAKIVLKEHVGWRRATGALVVLGGIVLLAR